MNRCLLTLSVLVAWPIGAQAQGTLEQAWAEAESANLELQQAAARTEEAAALRLEALSIQLVRASTQWTAAFNDRQIDVPEEFLVGIDTSSITVPPLQTKEAYSGTITVTQPLLRAAVFPAMQAATRAWRAAQLDESRARQLVRAGVAQAYWGLLAARAAEAVAHANVELADSQRDLAHRRTAAGLEGRRAVLRGELGVSRASRDLLTATKSLVDAEAAWARVLGSSPPAVLAEPTPPDVPDSLDAALKASATERADLRAANQRWEATQRQKSVEDTGWLPTVDFAVQARFNFTPTVLSPVPAQAGVGLQLNWDIFDGGLRIARSRQLEARARQAKLVLGARSRDVEQDVRTAWHALERAKVAVVAVEAEVALANEDLELAQRALDAGSGTLLEVQGARLSLAAARLAQIREGTARDLAAIELLLATGGL
jgi:outer membrane protein TolC